MEKELPYILGKIEQRLKGIEDKSSDGFDNINRRLDRVNGRLDKHEDKIDDLEKVDAENKGAMKITAILWGGVVSITTAVIAGIISYIIFRK